MNPLFAVPNDLTRIAYDVSGMVQKGMSILIFILYTSFLSIRMTWAFQHTHGSVLSAVMIHYMVNFCETILGLTLPILGIILLMGSILVLVFDKQIDWFQKEERRWTQILPLP